MTTNKLLNHLNLKYTTNDEYSKLECLWCGKTSLSINNEQPFEFQCFHCKQTGNGYTLIREFYEILPTISKAAATKLSTKKKGIRPITLKTLGIKNVGDTFFIPVLNHAGALVSLHKFELSSPSVIQSPKPLSLSILGLHTLSDDKSTVMICEGHWDYLVMLQEKLDSHICLLGVSGSFFPQSYLHYLANKHIILLFDNDEAGREGINHIARNLKANNITVASISYLDWLKIHLKEYKSIPDKFDIRDLYNTLQ